jgi:hypothetical protein
MTARLTSWSSSALTSFRSNRSTAGGPEGWLLGWWGLPAARVGAAGLRPPAAAPEAQATGTQVDRRTAQTAAARAPGSADGVARREPQPRLRPGRCPVRRRALWSGGGEGWSGMAGYGAGTSGGRPGPGTSPGRGRATVLVATVFISAARGRHPSPAGVVDNSRSERSQGGRLPAQGLPGRCGWPVCYLARNSSCKPHSVLPVPDHRPDRASSPCSTGRVQGQQPIEG